MNIEEVAQAILNGNKTHKPVLIAIDGYGGSGKSSIAEKLRKTLSSSHAISIDCFIVKERLLEQSPDEVLFDRDRLEQQVLKPARQGLPLEYQCLEWAENKLSEPVKIPTVDYLIIEGVSACHPDIAGYYDYKIWVDTPLEVARQRGKQRDAGNENELHWDLWSANDKAYQDKYHPEQHADFVIKNGV